MAVIDLSQLPAPQIVDVPDFETLLAERKAEFVALHPKDEQEAVMRTLELESEPVTKLLQENAYRELLLRQRINEAAQAVMVAYAMGGDLDHLAANYNVKRLTVTPADDDAVSGLLGALLSPIGLVVTALAGVALVVWKYWQPITAFLGGVVEGFKAAAGPISAAFEPLKPVFQWIGDKVQALWGWFTDLLTPVKSTSAELQSAAAMGRRFGEALAEGLNMVMHPLDSLKSGVSWLLEKLGIVSKEAAKAKLPESVTRQQPATVNADGKVMMPSGDFPSWGYGFAGMYDSGGYIPRGQFGIVGENGPEIVNGPANVTSRRNTAALAAVVAGMMGVAAAPAELPPLHPLALPAKGGEAMVSRAATVPPIYRIEAPTQIIIQTQPGQSAQDIAREVARQLDERERRLKAKARSNYSDQGGYDA
ncbi:TPA: tolA [Escherichia coli]|nr:tolA [Escherichia coli]EHC5851314.1 tolA [Escherichia coli]HAN7849407.1 tolA [Escherichia coli]HAN8171388.1 tolA [Escherichia coli]